MNDDAEDVGVVNDDAEDISIMKNDDARHIVNKVAEDVAIDFKDNVFNDEDSFRIHKPKI